MQFRYPSSPSDLALAATLIGIGLFLQSSQPLCQPIILLCQLGDLGLLALEHLGVRPSDLPPGVSLAP